MATADFRWLSGAELVTRYESSQGTFRTFCRVCGANLVSEFADRPAWLGLPLGTLDDDPGVSPRLHVHVARKAPWHEITDDLPRTTSCRRKNENLARRGRARPLTECR